MSIDGPVAFVEEGDARHGRSPRLFVLAYVVSELLALFAIWGHRYMPGVDMAQHANTMRLWTELSHGPLEYGILYRVNLFTPYLLTYAIGYPFARAFGGTVALKVVLSIAALGGPPAMAGWLRAVGGNTYLALGALPVIFGFPFQWGFLSHMLGLTFLFGFLGAFERQGERPTWRQALVTASWGVSLFFCHGVTYGVGAVVAGLRVLLRPHPLRMWRAALTLAPVAAVGVAWMLTREREVESHLRWRFPTLDRLEQLFSGFFMARTSLYWVEVGFGVLALAAIVARPKVNRSPAAWVPFLVALSGFLCLPDTMASTSVIGPRFCVYTQAFACGLWVAAAGRAWLLEGVSALVVLASLVLLNVRLTAYNHELDGFDEIRSRVGPYEDVMAFLPVSASKGRSDVFGYRGLAEAPAWVTAENGGLIRDDYARYYQMPVQRRRLHFPRRYRYIFTLGSHPSVMAAFPDAKLVARSGRWSLYERPPLRVGDLTVVRFAQARGDLRVDHAATDAERPLMVGAVVPPQGLGTRPMSWIRLRLPKGQEELHGAFGVDDASAEGVELWYRIRSATGETLTSGRSKKGGGATSFDVKVAGGGDLLLETFALTQGAEEAFGDWLALQVGPGDASPNGSPSRGEPAPVVPEEPDPQPSPEERPDQ
jgi:hypothetical protein